MTTSLDQLKCDYVKEQFSFKPGYLMKYLFLQNHSSLPYGHASGCERGFWILCK